MFGINRKADRLMQAMAEHEGWKPATETPSYAGSRAWRHHNPGNLRASPFASSTKEGFAVFVNDFVGFMAFQWDLMQKAKGNTTTGLGPESTIKDLLHVWAPPSDGNDTEAYVRSVVEKSGLPATTTLREIFER